jgi:hypothetical protein
MSVHGYRFSQLKKLSIGLKVDDLLDEFELIKEDTVSFYAESIL